jgi:hypothetical protein
MYSGSSSSLSTSITARAPSGCLSQTRTGQSTYSLVIPLVQDEPDVNSDGAGFHAIPPTCIHAVEQLPGRHRE